MYVTEEGHSMSSRSGPEGERPPERSLTLALDEFSWEAMSSESVRFGISIEELAGFAVLYYLADCDSGRIARKIPPPGA